MSERVKGTVKWFDNRKGYGFIEREGDKDVFVHYKEIRGDGYRSLRDGQEVEYTLCEGPKGYQAEDVAAV